jgi:hypothetical protein
LTQVTRNSLLMAALVTAAVLFGVNIEIRLRTRNTVPRQVMRHATQAPQAKVLALGNSLVAGGFKEEAFDKGMGLPSGEGALNIALGASQTPQQLLLLRWALQHVTRPRVLVYGFFDMQLTDPVTVKTGDLVGNTAMLYYVEPEWGHAFYKQSLHDRIEFELMRRFPMTEERGSLWAKVERLRRKIAQEGMPAQEVNAFGRVADFSQLEASSVAQFQENARTSMNRPLAPAVSEIVREASAAGAEVIFVEMPISPDHYRTFYETQEWRDYRAHLMDLARTRDVEYVNASDWFRDPALFADRLHLTDQGGTQFSERLGRDLRDAESTISLNLGR